MPMRHYLISTFLLLALAGLTTACGDHRNEAFCSAICKCTVSPSDLAECTNACTEDLDEADEQQDQPLITDECFACVNQTSCQRLDVACEAACVPIPNPDPPQDPQPGDQ